MKKIIALLLTLTMVLSLAACGNGNTGKNAKAENFKAGFIFLHDYLPPEVFCFHLLCWQCFRPAPRL